MFGGELAGDLGLVEGDFQENVGAGQKMSGGFGEDSTMNGQAVRATVESSQRFVFAHAAVQLGNLGRGNIWRIGDQQVIRLAIGPAIQRRKKIALLDGDAIRQTQAMQIFAGDGNGFFADVGGHDDRFLDVVSDGGGDATAAGAKVQDSRGFQTRLMPDELNDIFHERFGIRARDQHVTGDVEFEVEEMGPAGEVGDRFVLGGSADQLAISR